MISLILSALGSPLADTVFLLVWFVIAAGVTTDVLLTKSDVRAALGWIAAAWLSPILGGVLYFLFGINRVTRRALKLTRHSRRQVWPGTGTAPTLKDNIAQLAEISARVIGGELTGGNRITPLDGGDGAYSAMLAAIEGARKGVVLASYIFRNDEAGDRFIKALTAARARGVEVRVLLDSIGTGYLFSPMLRRLRQGGVTARRFLHTWLPWRMPFLNMRNHRKLLVVDGRLGFMGGINIGAENCRALRPKHHIDDIHFRVEGPAVRSLMAAFAHDWDFTSGEVLDDPMWWPDLPAVGNTFARGLSSGPDGDLYKLEAMLGAALTLARERVRIVTPYFLPDARLQFAIAQAALRGVKVEIIIPQKSDQRLMDWAMAGHVRFFRHVGARFIQTPPPFDHAKLATVDGAWSLIGSSNWDARSFRLNFEYDLECYGAEFAATLDALIDTRIARGREVTPDQMLARALPWRLRDAAARLLLPYL
ncbi:MAG: phospholipase [Alphaproteobacteria bacterium]|nr:phospholipase [Alphaproteobacteria bacterium]